MHCLTLKRESVVMRRVHRRDDGPPANKFRSANKTTRILIILIV